ncbi:MAG: hypothetical protein IJ819_07675 [Clostridiales bacterium]|nr:hypothetical protein [Clostridiales bacterium]
MENRNCSNAAVHIIRKDKAVLPVLSFQWICLKNFGNFSSLTCGFLKAFVPANKMFAMVISNAEAKGQTTIRIVSVKAVPS